MSTEHQREQWRRARKKYYYSEHGHKKVLEYRKKTLDRYRIHDNARRMVADHIRYGKLIKPDCCVRNDDTCCGRLEAHHEDYTKPLDIIWLCESHHRRHHS